MPALPESLASATADVLRGLGVNIRTGRRVMEVRAGEVVLDGGEIVPAELIVWAAGIKAPDFLRDLDGLESDRINRLWCGQRCRRPKTTTYLQSAIVRIAFCRE